MWPWIALVGCTAGDPAPIDVAGPLRFDGPAPRNLLVLSLDTMRRDHLGLHGATHPTPFLDSLAREGVWITDLAMCSNWTVASTACVLSGATNLDRAPERGMVPILMGDGPLASIPESPMLPKWLAQAGYDTLLATTNGFFSRAYGNAQGFAQVINEGPQRVREIWADTLPVIAPAGGLALSSPYYLHLHFFEPHRPYTPEEDILDPLVAHLPPPPVALQTTEDQNQAVADLVADPPVYTPAEADLVRDHMRARYVGEVLSFDAGLQEVWAEATALGLLDDTLVLFFTDHGEALWEHGGINAHGRLLHGNEADGIAFFWANNLQPAVVSDPVASEDLAPTVLAALSQPLPAEITGHPLGSAPADRPRSALTDAYQGVVQSVRLGEHRMQIKWRAPPEGESNVSLYDLAADPQEQVDLFDPGAPSPIALELWSELGAQVRRAEPWIAADPRDRTVHWPEGLPVPPVD